MIHTGLNYFNVPSFARVINVNITFGYSLTIFFVLDLFVFLSYICGKWEKWWGLVDKSEEQMSIWNRYHCEVEVEPICIQSDVQSNSSCPLTYFGIFDYCCTSSHLWVEPSVFWSCYMTTPMRCMQVYSLSPLDFFSMFVMCNRMDTCL